MNGRVTAVQYTVIQRAAGEDFISVVVICPCFNSRVSAPDQNAPLAGKTPEYAAINRTVRVCFERATAFGCPAGLDQHPEMWVARSQRGVSGIGQRLRRIFAHLGKAPEGWTDAHFEGFAPGEAHPPQKIPVSHSHELCCRIERKSEPPGASSADSACVPRPFRALAIKSEQKVRRGGGQSANGCQS